MKTANLLILLATFLVVNVSAKAIEPDKGLEYPEYSPSGDDLVISRSAYHEKLKGFWLAECIANWTGLRTEGVKKTGPFYTDEDWGTKRGRRKGRNGEPQMIEFVLVPEGEVWGADDDTDIEYIYQSILDTNDTSVVSGEHIRDGWLKHIKHKEQNFLWVSNEKALHLMIDGLVPPQTSMPENNEHFDQIDAQLTTEIFGLFAPTRADIALKMSHMPIRTTAYRDAEWIAEFYVIMHALASSVDPDMSTHQQVMWLAEEARGRLPNESFPAKMYDFVKREYEKNPDKDNWEATRDYLNWRHTGQTIDGYNYRSWFDAGINYGASLISLFYGQGDLKRTIKIGSLCGWDSDNPTATWGGLLGFLIGEKGVDEAFPDVKLSKLYRIGRTRVNFPDRTPDQPGDDSFELMSTRGIHVIDRVVIEEMGGGVDLEKDVWYIPRSTVGVVRAKY